MESSAIIKKIEVMEEEISEAKNKKSMYEGKISSAQEQLKKDHDCDTLEDGIKLKEKLEKEIVKEEKELETEFNEFTKEFDNIDD